MPFQLEEITVRRTDAVLALVFAALSVAGPAHAAPPDGAAGCQDFGTGVAGQAQDFGAKFGENASTAARSEPGAFPEIVVREEKRQACR